MTIACLKLSGNTPSKRARLTKRVIGEARASIQDFKNFVGRTSSEQVAFEEERMSLRISVSVQGSKSEKIGGVISGVVSGSFKVGILWDGILEHNLVILSSKYLRKDEARVDGESELGSIFGWLRLRRLFKVCHRVLGLFWFEAIRLRKYDRFEVVTSLETILVCFLNRALISGFRLFFFYFISYNHSSKTVITGYQTVYS